MFNKLYKVSSTGKVTEWQISVKDNTIIIEWGYTDGAKQTKVEVIKAGKNIGKANETTPAQQALLEAQSRWNKQLDKGYRQTITNLIDVKKYLPMLAKSYSDHGHKIEWPCYGQPKLDGVRCIAKGNGVLLSRKSKVFKALPHISQAVFDLDLDDFCLDGELYCHGDNFQKLISAIKRDEPSPQSHLIEYHVYDCIPNRAMTYVERANFLSALKLNHPIKLVETVLLKDQHEVNGYHSRLTSLGYEGVMLRNLNSLYEQDRRSENLQKVKSFQTEEFEIVGAEENKGMPGQCSIICRTANGDEFAVKPEGDDNTRRQYWKDYLAGNLVGKILTVRFFEYTTSDKSVPRFPVGISIRDYE